MSSLLAPITDLYELGGFVVLILAALSVVAFAVLLLKLWQFTRAGVGKRRSAESAVDAWVAGREKNALQMAEAGRTPLNQTVAAAMRGMLAQPTGRRTVEEDVQRIAQGALHQLSAGLRLLEAIAQIAPLLGLFGTVLGMIEAFQAMQGAGSNVDPSQLAGGIWVALLTTAVGLAVAMPTQLVVTWLDGRIENERVAMEMALAAVFTRRITEPNASLSRQGNRQDDTLNSRQSQSGSKRDPALVPGE